MTPNVMTRAEALQALEEQARLWTETLTAALAARRDELPPVTTLRDVATLGAQAAVVFRLVEKYGGGAATALDVSEALRRLGDVLVGRVYADEIAILEEGSTTA